MTHVITFCTLLPASNRCCVAENRFFSVADELAQRLGFEKIKTIDDCVMAAAGLPEPSPSHAETLAR
jgi:class 3 adenylate cyclase